ncbi:uncharacterized protein [Euwallacea similis]|uniref:uncharacterized protein n=1 Tax=Euwallacea similis TaxID=1736056 RepID=UPI00344FBFC2
MASSGSCEITIIYNDTLEIVDKHTVTNHVGMAPILYGTPASVPFRAVLMCAKAIGLELEIKLVDLFKGEHLELDFVKKNPQHTVPLLEDNGFFLADSHAINGYLVSKYGKENDSLYPSKNLERKATIDHRMYFDCSLLAGSGVLITKPLILEGSPPSPKALNQLREVFDILDKLLKMQGSLYAVGDTISIADFSMVASVSSWKYFVSNFEKDFPHVKAYLDRLSKEEFYKENIEGLEIFNSVVEAKLSITKQFTNLEVINESAVILAKFTMTPKIYGIVGSPPYGSVLMTAKVLGLKLDFQFVDLVAREHLKEDYLKKNPQHTVPLLEDNGFLLADSHAINGYLVGTYGTKEHDYLYPRNDIKRRALIDHCLHLDSSIVAARGFLISRPLILENIQPSKVALDGLRDAFVILDRQIKTQNNKYMVGDQLSIADFSVTSTVTSWGYFVKNWQKDFPNINQYIERMKKEDWFNANEEGVKGFYAIVDTLIK